MLNALAQLRNELKKRLLGKDEYEHRRAELALQRAINRLNVHENRK